MIKHTDNTFVFLSVVLITPVYGQTATEMRAVADRQTLLNDITDWFATAGQPDRRKLSIKKERRKIRRNIRLEKMRAKKQAQIDKKIQKEQQVIIKKQKAKQNAQYK